MQKEKYVKIFNIKLTEYIKFLSDFNNNFSKDPFLNLKLMWPHG